MNKETWIQIKKEYEIGKVGLTYNCFLCNSTLSFKSIWDKYEHEIKESAQMFLNSINTVFFIGDTVLFDTDELQTDEDKKNIRLQFLDYMINKTE